MKAKYAQLCARCDGPINIGDLIARVRGRVIHAACASGADE